MKPIKILTALILILSLFYIGCKPIVEEPAIKVTIDKKLLDEIEKSRPQEVFVFEIIRGEPLHWLKSMQEIASIDGKVIDSEKLLTILNDNRHLEIRKISNTAFYGDINALWKAEPTPEKITYNGPSDKEAKEIAIKWLEKSGFSNEDLIDVKISVSNEEFEITTPENKDKPQPVIVGKNIEVRRQIDGLLIYGSGSKIKIFLGEEGRINGFIAVWRQLKPGSAVLGHKPSRGKPEGKMMKPLNAHKAFENLKLNPLDNLPIALVHWIDISKVEFGYFSRSATDEQRFLQPVYVFSGKAYAKLPDGKEVDVPYTQYVVALDKPLEPIWHTTIPHKFIPREKDVVSEKEEGDDEEGNEER